MTTRKRVLVCCAALALATTLHADTALRGALSDGDQSVHGTLYVESSPMPNATTGGEPGTCTPFEASECFAQCGAQLTNVYCAAVASFCSPTGGGPVDCKCWYFCVTVGGKSWKPKDKMDGDITFPALEVNQDE